MLNYFFILFIKNIYFLFNNYKVEGINFLLWDNFIMFGVFVYILFWVFLFFIIKVILKFFFFGVEGLYLMWIFLIFVFIVLVRVVVFFLYIC